MEQIQDEKHEAPVVLDRTSKQERALRRKLRKASEKAEKQKTLDKLGHDYLCPHPVCKKPTKSFEGALQFVHHVYVDPFPNHREYFLTLPSVDKHSIPFVDLNVCLSESDTKEELSGKISQLLGLPVGGNNQ